MELCSKSMGHNKWNTAHLRTECKKWTQWNYVKPVSQDLRVITLFYDLHIIKMPNKAGEKSNLSW